MECGGGMIFAVVECGGGLIFAVVECGGVWCRSSELIDLFGHFILYFYLFFRFGFIW